MERLISQIAEAVATNLNRALSAGNGKRGDASRGPSPLRGKKLDMRCRYPGCKNRSKGPKFHFLCEKHLKKPGWPAAKAAIAKAAKA
jgi:hypothetical protein